MQTYWQSILGEVEKHILFCVIFSLMKVDMYLAQRIAEAEGNNIVVVVELYHVPGIKKYFGQNIDLEELKTLPPKGIWGEIFKWAFPA